MFCCSVQLFASNMGPQVLRHSGTLLIENISNKKLLITCPLPFTRETGISSTEIKKWGGEKRSSRLTCSSTLAKEEIDFLLNTSFIPWPSKEWLTFQLQNIWKECSIDLHVQETQDLPTRCPTVTYHPLADCQNLKPLLHDVLPQN